MYPLEIAPHWQFHYTKSTHPAQIAQNKTKTKKRIELCKKATRPTTSCEET